MQGKFENFFLPESLFETLDPDEVDATFEAMVECQVAKTPFEAFCITVPERAVIKITGEKKEDRDPTHMLEFYFIGMSEPLALDGHQSATGRMKVFSWHGRRSVEYFIALANCCAAGEMEEETAARLTVGLQNLGADLIKLLVVLLATRNVKKTREKNKLAALGIGKKRQGANHSYTTTISYSHSEDRETEVTGTGRQVRPHLRRGHVRRQHYGPKGEFIKKVFIEPTFVNSDKEFVSFRERYNVSLAAPQVAHETV